MHGLAAGDGQFQDVLAVGYGLLLKIQYLALVSTDQYHVVHVPHIKDLLNGSATQTVDAG